MYIGNNNKNDNEKSAPLLVANQDLMRRMEQISRKVAGTLQKKQDNSSYTTNSNTNKGSSLNKTEWVVVHLAREILQRHLRVQVMIAAGYLGGSSGGSGGACNDNDACPKEQAPAHKEQDHWNPAFLSWDTLIANWIRDGRLVSIMATMNDLHSCLQQQQQQQQTSHHAMDDVAIDRVSQMLGIHAEQWELLCQRNQKRGQLTVDSSNSKDDPAPTPETAKNSCLNTYPYVSMTTEVATNPSPGTRLTTADDPFSSASTTAHRTSPGRNNRGRQNNRNSPRRLPPGQCHACGSKDHFLNECPDKSLGERKEIYALHRAQVASDELLLMQDEIPASSPGLADAWVSGSGTRAATVLDRLRASRATAQTAGKPILHTPQKSPNDGSGSDSGSYGNGNGETILSTSHRIASPSDAMTTTSLMETTSTSRCNTKDEPSTFGVKPVGLHDHGWTETSAVAATAATTVADAFSCGPLEPVPFRRAAPLADIVLASSSNNSDSNNQKKTLAAATSTDSITQVPVSPGNSDPKPIDGENDAAIGPADGKFLVGIKVQQRYLQLCHANKCKSDNCPSELNCPVVKLLCRHIKDCRSDSCGYLGCLSSRAVLRHAAVLSRIRRCHDGISWQVCVSTRDCSTSEPTPPAFLVKATKPVQTQVQVHQDEHRPIKKRRVTLDTASV